MAHTELGRKLLDRLTEDLKELATVDSFPKLDGRNMVMLFAPLKRPERVARPTRPDLEEASEPAAVSDGDGEG
jgi:hypothetical protein